MLTLFAGVLLWSAVHLLPALAPGVKSALVGRLGAQPYRGLYSLALLVALAMMIFGYRAADWVMVFDPPAWAMHANNLLMLISVYLFAVGGMRRTWLGARLRHPMLAGALVWSGAHLLVNGDLASALLFGGMGVWSLAEMIAINRRDGAWTAPKAAGAMMELRAGLGAVAVFAAIIFIHGWVLGVRPIPG
ncbi:MAG: NnrU family protein [Pikeienuella sp.]